MIRLRTLGECAIDVNGTTIRPGATMGFAVLLYLGAEGGRRVEREQLAAMFWPRASTARRRHNLRQILYKLSQLGVRAGGSAGPLCLPSNEVWLDFEDEPAEDGGARTTDAPLGTGRIALAGYAPRTATRSTGSRASSCSSIRSMWKRRSRWPKPRRSQARRRARWTC